jgi:glycosyltransferase involved in cell wall biosynthesis
MMKVIFFMITLCLIAKNEGTNIAQCLESFARVADQTLIIDTGSSDDTREIAQSKGATVLDFDWVDDFSAARNFALDQVKTPWVMMIDPDFRISSEDSRLLRDFIDTSLEQWDVVDLPREFHGSIADHPRLWRSDLKLRYIYPVHEYLPVPALLRRTRFEVMLRHTGIKDYAESRRYYISLMEKYLSSHPPEHRMLYYLLSDNRFLREYKKAIAWGEQYLKSNPPDDHEVARVLCHMGFCLWALHLVDDAEKAFQQALVFDPLAFQKTLFFEANDQELQLLLTKLSSSL